MKLTIEKFASMFCFGHVVSSATNEEDLCCDIREYKDFEYNDIFDTIQLFGVRYSKQFMEGVVKIFIMDVRNDFASKKKLMCFVLSRCMVLSETPTLFSFILVCIFVNTVISGIFIPLDLECFTLAKTVSKCLIAAFYRQYVDLFDKENGFEGLARYCEKLNVTELCSSDEDSDTENERHSINLEGFTPPSTEELIDILHKLKAVESADFTLTDFEEKLLYEQDLLPSDIEPCNDILTQLTDISKLSTIEKLDIMQNFNLKSELVLERLNNLCMLCKDKCYKHVVFAAKDLEIMGNN